MASPATDILPLYACFDFALRSEIALGELPVADSVADERDVIDVRLGPVPEMLPETLPGAGSVAKSLQVAGDTVLLTLPGVARYLVRGGREIVVDPAPGGSDRTVRLFLLGSALGILCHQRGLLLLHANAIVAGDGAYAFAGNSGAGKSTLAAHFQRAGYPVLCDDVCAISFDQAHRPFAWQGLPRLKLWGDAAEAFGHDRARLDVAVDGRDGRDKYHVPFVVRQAAVPVPFRRLYLLARAEGAAGGFARLQGAQAMEAILTQTYRGQYLAPMGLAARHFRQCLDLLAHAEIYSAARAWGYAVFDREAALLEDHVLHGDPPPGAVR
jgi:hypothetical protein